jgi:hypothetical protein
MRWVAEYWDNKKKEVECYCSESHSWLNLPINNFLYLYVVNDHYILPYGLPGTEYTTVVSGWDYYTLFGDVNEKLVFGGWNDKDKFDPEYPHYGIGRIHELWPNGKHNVNIIDIDFSISFGNIKNGVELKEPWATKCGFITGKRTLPSCLELI